ncbi:MAG: (d)CMP kinase [Pseudomonadota bacterium]
MSVPIITVDGPGGAGKGTLCFSLAQTLGWHMLDSGALYRVTAQAAKGGGVDLDDEAAVAAVAAELDVGFIPAAEGLTRVMLADTDITDAIRTEDCGALASKVAAMQPVRAALLDRQRRFASPPGLVADGRDMGTVVFPAADLKIFLTASPSARALRRQQQLLAQGESVSLPRLLETIEERDARDRNRSDSPLLPANDAIVVDSTERTAAEVLGIVLGQARSRALIS